MLDSHFISELERIVGHNGLLRDAAEMLAYESDGLSRLHATPGCVVLPASAGEVQQVVRGHGTGLSGGALIVLSKLNRVLEVDIPNQRVTVEPGVINLDVTRRVACFPRSSPPFWKRSIRAWDQPITWQPEEPGLRCS